jgi:hypothetical protein
MRHAGARRLPWKVESQMSFRQVQAYFRLGLLHVDDLPRVACDLLGAGYDSDPLVLLAGLPQRPDPFEARDLFEKAVRQEGLPDLNEKEAGWIVAYHLASQIISGTISPHAGARQIWWEVWNRIGRPAELMPFVALADEYDELGPRDHAERAPVLDEEIVEAAKMLLQRGLRDRQLGEAPAPRNGV